MLKLRFREEVPAVDGRVREIASALDALDVDLHQHDFLLTWEHSLDELKSVLLLAEALEELHRVGVSARVFGGGLAVMNFRDKSTRTRFSFAGAADMLGLTPSDLDETKSQIGHGETVRETANMISFLTEVIGIRDDLYIHEGHAYMTEVAAAVEEGYREGVLAQRPAVINLQCDRDHPTQTLADLLHLRKHFGSLDALRGKRIAMTWAYSPSYGKPLSVPQGIITLLTRFGMDVVLAHPPGYDLLPETVEHAQRFARKSGGSFSRAENMADAFRDADVIYPKSWAPFHVMEERTRILRSDDMDRLAELERECLANNAGFKHWECNEHNLSATRNGEALYMHCLPADISGVSCEAGEVSSKVFDRYRLATYHEASHKPFVIAAMIILTRFRNAPAVLRHLVDNPHPRRVP